MQTQKLTEQRGLFLGYGRFSAMDRSAGLGFFEQALNLGARHSGER